MNCYKCLTKALVFCPFSKCFVCSNHIAQHISDWGEQTFQGIDKDLTNFTRKAVQDKLICRISLIDKVKQSISKLMKDSIQEIINSGNSAIKKLEMQTQWWTKIANMSKYPQSLLKEVDHFMSTEMCIDFFISSSKLTPIINEIFSLEISEVAEDFARKRSLDTCMSCSVNGTVFEAFCKHLICAKCSKFPCKICKIKENANEIYKKDIKKQDSCDLCRKCDKRNQKFVSGHSVCQQCVHSGCCDIKTKCLPNKIIGDCELCKKTKIPTQKTLCNHLRCESCKYNNCCLCDRVDLLKYNTVGRHNSGKSFLNRSFQAKNASPSPMKNCKNCRIAFQRDLCTRCSYTQEKNSINKVRF